MARWANDLVMDAALDYIEDTEDICVCEGQPTTSAEALSDKNLATIGITSGCYSNLAVVKTSTSVLVYVWVLTEQYLTATNTITTPELYAEIQDPTAP